MSKCNKWNVLFMRKKCLTSNSNKRCMCSESSSSSLHKKEHMGLAPSVCGARLFTSQSSQHINNTTISRQMCITRQQLPVNFMIFVVLWAQENPFKSLRLWFFFAFSNFLICDLAINTNETKIRFLHGSGTRKEIFDTIHERKMSENSPDFIASEDTFKIPQNMKIIHQTKEHFPEIHLPFCSSRGTAHAQTDNLIFQTLSYFLWSLADCVSDFRHEISTRCTITTARIAHYRACCR